MTKANVAAMPQPELMEMAAKPAAPNRKAELAARLTQKASVKAIAVSALQDAVELETQVKDLQGAEGEGGQLGEVKARAVDAIVDGIVSGFLTFEEATALYGDAYGYAIKKDGTPSKTPNGTGNNLRKRSTLIAQAIEVSNNDSLPEADWPKALQGKSRETIAAFTNDYLGNGLSCWQVYKELSAKDKAEPVALPLNEKKLLEIAKYLQDEVNIAAIRENAALSAVYTAICEAFTAE